MYKISDKETGISRNAKSMNEKENEDERWTWILNKQAQTTKTNYKIHWFDCPQPQRSTKNQAVIGDGDSLKLNY